jgi:hypothetical protein
VRERREKGQGGERRAVCSARFAFGTPDTEGEGAACLHTHDHTTTASTKLGLTEEKYIGARTGQVKFDSAMMIGRRSLWTNPAASSK